VVGLDVPNAAGVAALYGSVSSVTFAKGAGHEMPGYVAGLVALMELGILVALFYGRLAWVRLETAAARLGPLVLETIRGRGLILLGGSLIIGAAIGETNYKRIEPFFVELFRGVLVLFLLEMGMAAARQLREFASVGMRMVVFAAAVPMLTGFLATGLATMAGLPLGAVIVLGAVAASVSYIDAPAAVRSTFPEANPGLDLTSSLGLTFPFMLTLGMPSVLQMALAWQAWLD
jgi:hypothetical protein